MTKPTELKTERLLLRPFRLSDVGDVLEYASDPEWAAFRLRPYDRGAAERMVARALLTSWDKEAEFTVVLDGRVIGRFSLTVDHKHQTAELGYEIARDVWGNGLAPEASAAVCDWGFREYGLARIDAWADPRNKRSVRVMEKLGMTYEGMHRKYEVGRGERVDGVSYAVLRGEWSGLRGPLPSIGATTPKYDTTDHGECRRMTTPRLVLRHSAQPTWTTCSSTPKTLSGRNIFPRRLIRIREETRRSSSPAGWWNLIHSSLGQ